MFLVVIPGLAWAEIEEPSVLVINSYHAGQPWVADHNKALFEGLSDRARLSFYDMDTKRVPTQNFLMRAEAAYAEFKRIKPDVVVLTDDNALRLLGRRITNKGVPVVFLGINNNPREYFDDMHLVTGVLERPLLKRSVFYLQDILGKRLRKCLVMFDNGVTSNLLLNTTFGAKKDIISSDTEVSIRLHDTLDQWQRDVLAAKENGFAAVILGLYHSIRDDQGHHVPSEYIARWTSRHSPVPVFAFWDFAVGKNLAIGGLVLAGKPQGKEAVKLVQRILAGERPENMFPVTAEEGQLMFSRHELERWGIKLPVFPRAQAVEVRFVE